jgi:hypothetical protein
MKRFLLPFLISVLLACPLNADDIKGQNRDLSELIGRFVLVLSRDYVVSVQDFDQPTLWANAKLGRVNHPRGMLPSMGMISETEMVPTESGIILRFHGPYAIGSTQMVWSTWRDTEKRTFEITVNVSDGKFIGVTGSYGAVFPSKTIDDLLSISTQHASGQ